MAMARTFWACTAEPGFEYAEAKPAATGLSVMAVSTPTPPFGLPRWLTCPTGKSTENGIEFPDVDDTGELLLTVPVQFGEVDIVSWPVTFFDFLLVMPDEFRLQIRGESGSGYSTHRLHFIDANGARTPIINDPFTAGTPHVLDLRYAHSNSATVQIWIDKQLQATVIRDCLKTAGDVSYLFSGPIDLSAPPVTPTNALYFGLPVHHADAQPGDYPAPYYATLPPFVPRGYQGPTPPVDHAGTPPGDDLDNFGGKDARALGDDDDTTYVGYLPTGSAAYGGAWSCDEDWSASGPAGKCPPNVVDYACKWVWGYRAAARDAASTDPGLVYGRKRAGAYTLATTLPGLSPPIVGHSVQQVPGDAQYPDPHTDYAALGLKHDAADSVNNYVRVYGCWAHLLIEWDSLIGQGGYGAGSVWPGDDEWLGDIEVL